MNYRLAVFIIVYFIVMISIMLLAQFNSSSTEGFRNHNPLFIKFKHLES